MRKLLSNLRLADLSSSSQTEVVMGSAARPGDEEHFQKCHSQLSQFSSWPAIARNEERKARGSSRAQGLIPVLSEHFVWSIRGGNTEMQRSNSH